MNDTPAAAPTLRHIGRYRILSEIGRGGMGVVYRCEDERIGRSVAVKTLTDVTPELRERFYVEARSGILSHPNIVTVYELGEHEGVPFIAMEFLNGESLETLLRSRGRLSLLDALPIVQQLCDGLGYAHSQGLLHRDIKPANVIVLPDGLVKIVDFGIARLADQQTRLTRTDSLLGTFHYIAPERLKGQPSDGRADLWSVGVILYELITGELPFRGKDVSTLYRMMHEPYIPLAELVPTLPAELTPILDRALAKDLDHRYGSADEMAIDLRALDNQLKQTRIDELLSSARQLLSESHLGKARTLALQAQRLDPANATARLLLQELGDRLNHLQREEQLRQLLEQAEGAVSERQFDLAVSLLEQAAHLDPDHASSVTSRLGQVRSLQEQSQRVRSLCEEAKEARGRGDLTTAQRLLEQALSLDTRSTSLRQAHALVLRDLRQQEEATRIEGLLRSAREAVTDHRYTEALVHLREAAEVDPTHAEVQQLLLAATSEQRQQRRREALEQVVAEIQDCLDRHDLPRAADRVTRALETLPHEPTLLRLRGEIDTRTHEQEIDTIVRTAVLEAQHLLDEQPADAIAVLDVALTRAPGDSRLLQFRSRLAEHQAVREREEIRRRRLHQAEQALQASRPDDAIHTLELEAAEGGDSPDLANLLARACDARQAIDAEQIRTSLLQKARDLASAGDHQQILHLLANKPEVISDPELSALRGEAERRLQDLAHRVEAVIARAQSTATHDLSGALRLLREQPPNIRQNSAVLAVATTLAERQSVENTIATALQASLDLLSRQDFRSSIRPLDKLAATLGENHGSLQRARASFATAREQAANTAVRAALARAHQALSSNSPRSALRVLKAASTAATFAGPRCQEDLHLLEKHAAAQRSSTTNRTLLQRATAARPSSPPWTRRALPAAAAVVVLGTAAAAALLHHRAAPGPATTPTATAAPTTATSPASASSPSSPPGQTVAPPLAALAIAASPWATVLSLQDASGKPIALPHGEQPTPLRVAGLVPGTYTVALRGPDNQITKTTCATSTTPDDVCNTTFVTPALDQLLAGAQQ